MQPAQPAPYDDDTQPILIVRQEVLPVPALAAPVSACTVEDDDDSAASGGATPLLTNDDDRASRIMGNNTPPPVAAATCGPRMWASTALVLVVVLMVFISSTDAGGGVFESSSLSYPAVQDVSARLGHVLPTTLSRQIGTRVTVPEPVVTRSASIDGDSRPGTCLR
jgi:hypothetical protein